MDAAQPTWIALLAVACGLVAVVVLAIVVVLGVLMTRRKLAAAANADELAELREENERLRAENERLKQGQAAAGSTDIQEM